MSACQKPLGIAIEIFPIRQFYSVWIILYYVFWVPNTLINFLCFSLSRPKEELIREILGDAFKSSSVGSKETTKLKAGKTGIPIEDLNKTVQVQLSSVGDQTDATQGQSDAKESSDQAGKISKPHADTNNNGSRGAKKVRRKAPPPPRPRPPTRRKTSTPVAPAVEKQNDVKEVKSSLSQEKCEERASKKGAKPLTSSRKGKKSKSKNSYPKELNPFDTSSEETRSLSPVMSSSPREMSVQTCDKGTMGKGDGEEKASYTGVPSPKERRKKRHGTKKTKKYPKELNPFGGSSDEEAKTPSSKEAEMKEGVASNVCGEEADELSSKEAEMKEGVASNVCGEEADEPSSKEAEMKEGVASNVCGEEADEPSSKEAEMKEGVASSVCSDEANKPSSKEAEMKEGVASSVCRGKLGEQKSSEKSSFSDETVLTEKVRRKAPPPPKPRPPTRRKTPAPVAELREKQKDVKEVKSSSVQGNSEEKASKTDDKPLSSCRKGRKTKSKNSYPKELNPFDTSSEETRSLSPEMTSSPQEMSVQTCERGTTEKGDGEEKASYTGVPSPKERHKKCHGIKKSKKYPKELNPLGGSSDEEADTRSSKEAEMKEGVASSVCSEKLGEQKSSEKSSFSDETVVLKKAKPFKPENTELSGGKAEDVVCCAVVDSGTTFGTTYSGTTDAKKRNQRSLSSEAVYSLRKNTPVYEELPVIGAADHSGATASGGIGRGQREATTTGTQEKIHETTVTGELRKAVKAEETDSAAKEKEKQRLACFFNKLLRPVPQKGEIMMIDIVQFERFFIKCRETKPKQQRLPITTGTTDQTSFWHICK